MRKLIARFALFGLMACAPLKAAELEDAEREIVDAINQTKSLEVHSETTQAYTQQGQDFETHIETMYAFQRKDGRLLYTSDVKAKNHIKRADGTTGSNETRSVIVTDGEYTYTLNEGPNGKSAAKNFANNAISYVIDQTYFDRLRNQYSVHLLPDETINEKPHYVIECALKTPLPNGMARMVLYFDKKTGVNTKTVGYDAGGKAFSTTMATDVKVNSTLPDDFFVFKTPEGVKFLDSTKPFEVPKDAAPKPDGEGSKTP